MNMSSRILIRVGLLVSALALAASAQIRGVPASATSVTRISPFNRNIPASATSLGPFGFSSGKDFVHFGKGRHRLARHQIGFFPIGIPTPVIVIADDDDDEPAPIQVASNTPAEPQKIEITIVDRRSQPNEKKSAPADPAPAKLEPKAEAAPEPEIAPTIIVLANGSRKELRNYAIMGKDLFDLADNKMLRIPLETVNVDATVAANAANGKQFRLP
jgi:hypothetical protein